MRVLGLIIATFIFSIGQLNAGSIYNGTFVDAHSQVGNLISNEKVSEMILKGGVDLTLLSFRPPKRQLAPGFKEIEELTEKRVRFLIPTKYAYFREDVNPERPFRILNHIIGAAKDRDIDFVGFQEVIVQHAPHNHKRFTFEGMNLDLKSEKVLRMIDVILKHNKPVILHVELNDYEKDSDKVLQQLLELSDQYPKTNFLLIHMAQAKFSEAKLILEKTKNIHFMTSHSDNEFQRMAKRNKQRIAAGKKSSGQHGWINLFNEHNKLQTKWIKLMNKNPSRFVLALDNVWDKQWLEGYAEKVLMWRKSLASLKTDAGTLIACGNANQYFKLNIACKRDGSD